MDGAMKITEELIAAVRSSVHQHLELVADAQSQREYERNVSVADVPAELVCGWFDDVYHPESPAFQAAFTRQQRAILAVFNEAFRAATAELPKKLPRLCELQAHPAWQRVISAATRALRGVSSRSD